MASLVKNGMDRYLRVAQSYMYHTGESIKRYRQHNLNNDKNSACIYIGKVVKNLLKARAVEYTNLAYLDLDLSISEIVGLIKRNGEFEAPEFIVRELNNIKHWDKLTNTRGIDVSYIERWYAEVSDWYIELDKEMRRY